MKIGYARVSTEDQNLDLQLDALTKAGCADTYIYREEISGSTRERPQLQKLLEQIREGDVVVIWKLDRLGRSLADLVHLVTEIQGKGAGLLSLDDNIDTTTPQGELTFNIFAVIAEFEREIIREHTNAGFASALAKGRHVFLQRPKSKPLPHLLYTSWRTQLPKYAGHLYCPRRLYTNT